VTAVVRPATRADADSLLGLVDALADYERLPRPEPAARARLVEDAFGARQRIEVLLALDGDQPVGYALFFETYSSFLALPTMYLEDLFVHPAARGARHGYHLFRAVAATAVERGCGRMEWNVLKWNRLARDFYERLGAAPLADWQMYRLEGEQLQRAAGA
jgi:GNAT superfamily N-acetyltransferase